uniref:Uncharacterized protein n=1 Tax=Sphaerodactylus townsendi TaxID=933632 RepID=A0ACB8FXA6_9SAUR
MEKTMWYESFPSGLDRTNSDQKCGKCLVQMCKKQPCDFSFIYKESCNDREKKVSFKNLPDVEYLKEMWHRNLQWHSPERTLPRDVFCKFESTWLLYLSKPV